MPNWSHLGRRRAPTYTQVRAMPLAALNRITGEVEVVTKRGKVMQGKIGTKRLAHVRSYLRLRPETSNPALLITEAGKAVSYWGGHMIWRRIQKRSGVQKPGQPPDLRVFGQGMARARASIADIQDVLGLESDKMARHYAWDARSFAAANLMTKYSLAG